MACVDICPKGAITVKDDLSAYNAVIDPEKCIGCDSCYRVCPHNHPAKAKCPKSGCRAGAQIPCSGKKALPVVSLLQFPKLL